MKGTVPMLPKIAFPIVDVRDVALAHVVAMENPDETAGKRIILCENSYMTKEYGNILREEFEKKGYKIPKKELGKGAVSFFGLFNK